MPLRIRFLYIFLFFGIATSIAAIVFVAYQKNGQESTLLLPAVPAREQLTSTMPEIFQYAGPWDKELYDSLYVRAEKVTTTELIKGGIVPHHLLAGHLAVQFVETIKKQKPSVVVIISPNHFSRGTAPVITTNRNWKTVYGNVQTHHSLVQTLQKNLGALVAVDEETIKEEHGIYGLIPFFARSMPETSVLPILLRHDIATSTMDALVDELEKQLPKDAVVVASVDFSHYQIAPVANFHDELSRNVIQTFDYSRLPLLEIDSVPSVYTLLKLMEAFGTKRVVYEAHANAADIVGNQAEKNLTSYYTPYFAEGASAIGQAVSVLSFGDIMLDRDVAGQIEVYGPDVLLQTLAGEEGRFFRGMDIVSANMEGPFASKRQPTSKEIAFRFDPALLPMLKRYNFSVFSQANNHSYDMGKEAEAESKNLLRAAGFSVYGSQYTVDDASLLIRNISGKKIAFIGVNDTNGPVNEKETLRLIAKAEIEADVTILNAHWGEEYKEISNNRQRYLARLFVDAGVDAVIGHHPHWIQEMEVYRERPIFYSLGNFIFDQYFSVPTQQGLGVGLVFHPDHISGYIFPLESKKSQVSLMPLERARGVIGSFVDRSRIEDYTVTNFHFSIPIISYAAKQPE